MATILCHRRQKPKRLKEQDHARRQFDLIPIGVDPLMPRYENLEDVIADFHKWPDSHNEEFEQEFLSQRLALLHPEATAIRFCGGEGFSPGPYSNRTVQVWVGRDLMKSYKYDRR